MEAEGWRSATLQQVLESAARLQRAAPDAVLVGEAAAALHAGHRDSFDHDHVLENLAERYFEVLAAVEATDGWVTNVRASSPPMTIMGSLGGVEAGLRQLRRTRPLEVEQVDLGEAGSVRAPTAAEILRIKAYLVVQRNQVRDYLDVVALAAPDVDAGVRVLAAIDDYYRDRSGGSDSVLTALVQRLSEPNPRDQRVTRQLHAYKGLDPRWQRWTDVVTVCQALADVLFAEVARGGS